METLTDAGVPEAQAKAEAKAFNEAMSQIKDTKDLATKSDIFVLEKNITVLEASLRKDMAEMKSDIFRAMLIQTFAIAGMVGVLIKFIN
jgi:polyhydroxyalkanoate synthesis regulator phasin